MTKYTRFKNDANAERDFNKAVTAWGYGITAPRSVAYYHHTATAIGYVGAREFHPIINYYNGKFGAGFVEYRRNNKYPSLSYKNYYIFAEYYKNYKK